MKTFPNELIISLSNRLIKKTREKRQLNILNEAKNQQMKFWLISLWVSHIWGGYVYQEVIITASYDTVAFITLVTSPLTEKQVVAKLLEFPAAWRFAH